MKTFKNSQFIKRDYECQNVVACRAEVMPTRGTWEPADESILSGLTMIERVAGVEYWGYL